MAALSLRERLDLRRFFRGEKATDGPIVLSHRRIFILPNRYGLALALLLLIQWLTAINYGNNLAFILTFLLAAAAMASVLYGYRNLSGLIVDTGKANPVFVGDQALFELRLNNRADMHRYAIELKLKGAETIRMDIPAEGTIPAVLRVRAEKRGWLELDSVIISTTFPLGIFYAWSPINLNYRIMVYPKPARERLPFPRSGGDHLDGRASHSSDDFHGFRAYQAGDPFKHIHWKGLAKGGDPLIRQYTGGETEIIHLSWTDTRETDTEARLSRLCRWLLDAEQAEVRYSLHMPGTTIAENRGASHCRKCLEALALFHS
ncbi:uncharacterized protein sS8_3648 [Methylocaldum marinum]|uniref:Uncharacterized protein n=1 Tax=Methylocaldum marinum TaxID=1432792 RepID=A0A250KVD6_9GAMM|nr:DUF58 domain-containing protein [Methylocaldum marinum]BBA35585.1 uncharacterized protein sS8_3648 [Methylocaldum marinum]